MQQSFRVQKLGLLLKKIVNCRMSLRKYTEDKKKVNSCYKMLGKPSKTQNTRRDFSTKKEEI